MFGRKNKRTFDGLLLYRYQQARRRSRMILNKFELLSWMDNRGTDLARHINDYRKRQDRFVIGEMREAVSDLTAFIDELEERHDERQAW